MNRVLCPCGKPADVVNDKKEGVCFDCLKTGREKITFVRDTLPDLLADLRSRGEGK